MSNYVRGWHFVGDRLRDGRPVPPDGVWLEHEGPIVWCRSGLYGSRRPSGALRYSSGPVLCVCDFDGIEAEHDDKFVARRRRIVRRIDATEMLRYYARMRALSVVHLWDAKDVVLDFLMTGDERIRAAVRDATRPPALDTAWYTAWDAARDAALSATWWDAAWDAAWGAARNAAWAESRAAAWDEFDALVYETMGEAHE